MKKIEFTEEQNFRIAQLVEVNKTAPEIVEDLNKNFGLDVSIPTLKKQIARLRLNLIDGRKWTGRHKRGYFATEEESKSKPVSKYKLKQMNNDEVCWDAEQIKTLGYGEDGLPLNYKLIRNKSGEIEDVELTITMDDVKYSGGEGCELGSLRWWNIERMRFDYGCPGRRLLNGQVEGDWKGVRDKLKYCADGSFRYDPIDIIKEQQEGWERFVDAAIVVLKDMENKTVMSSKEVNDHNIFIINHMKDSELIEMMTQAPDIIYKYIPTYLYGSVVKYCIDKMFDEGRVNVVLGEGKLYSNMYDTLKKSMNSLKNGASLTNCNAINLQVVKQCLFLNPNDYEYVVKKCCYTALEYDLVAREYKKMLSDIVSKVSFKGTGNVVVDMIAMDMDTCLKNLDDALYGRERRQKEFCKKYGLI